ncbi:hypothetical protein MHBO_002761 [Bonamia ostreae]|uniref:CDP-diacylglycerol--inositol 3-phosphatidyltransferase n=1 Tax=Bonamia ostreae TaxID=126728 RepID=A0ABV2AP08_9EUKA
MAARNFSQCSRFGAVLDMLTDRISNLVLYFALSEFTPVFMFSVAAIDIASHWIQMYSKLLHGQATHKQARNIVLSLYYKKRLLMGFLCVGAEVHMISKLIFLKTDSKNLAFVANFLSNLTFIVFIAKTFVNLIQLIESCSDIAEFDRKDNKQ